MLEILMKPSLLIIYHKRPYGVGQPKPNDDEGDIMWICVLVIHFLLILFVIMLPSPDFYINFPRV